MAAVVAGVNMMLARCVSTVFGVSAGTLYMTALRRLITTTTLLPGDVRLI